MMQQLADFEINEVLIEAGFKLNGSLISAGLVDELVIYLAPCLIGDAARGMLKLPELANLADKRALKINDVRMLGTDIRLTCSFS
jgi:diaminohydroxyphosphoribosylaminopyrimidine deaminase/5-amino-6-(5-phosphoribosylamino)uracil reductase